MTRKYVNEDDEQISGFFDLNIEIRETYLKTSKICMNDKCKNLTHLPNGDRPRIDLGKRCWNCKSDQYLKASV